jgi:hypothetical protein
MASLIYGGGDHDTAIANITTAINARISTQADGTKVLDAQSLIAWVRAQIQVMLADGEATSDAYIAQLDPTTDVQVLANVIAPSHWQARPDWPLHNQTTSTAGTASAAAVYAQQAKLKRVAQDATNFFKDTPQILEDTLTNYFNANIVSTIDDGVTRLEENRAYIVTYVTDRGEESAPSPASELVEVDQNDSVDITVPAAPSGRNISHFRLYRSNSTNTSAAFQYVPCAADDEGWPIGTLTVTDDKKAAELQEPCPSILWDEPPADLQGLVGGANGGMAGFRENEFCPCVPYIPYAFPVSMRITTEWPIVGLGSSGQTYFVGTRARPYLITGADTQSLSSTKLEDEQACVSRRSIVGMAGGFLYASPDGICLATAGGVRVISDEWELFDRTTWQSLDPSSIIAAESEGCYVFRWDNGTTHGIYSLHLPSRRLIAINNTGSALFRDAVTDRLYIASGVGISAMFASATKRTAQWRSKIITQDSYPTYSWLQAQSNFEGGGTITVNIYVDGALLQTSSLSSREPVRVKPGSHREWELEVLSACRATMVTLASSTEELQAL